MMTWRSPDCFHDQSENEVLMLHLRRNGGRGGGVHIMKGLVHWIKLFNIPLFSPL